MQRAGDRLRITAQLVNTGDGFELWSQSFDRDVSDVFAVQDEVALAVVSALEVELIGDPSAHVVEQGTASVDAYQAYLQGLFFWNKRTTADIARAAEFFHQAIAADSTFARAWGGLASAYVLFVPSEYDVPGLTPEEALDRAERAARRALELDDDLAEAHTALGLVFSQLGRFADADASFRRAIASDQPFPTAHQWYATFLVVNGRAAEGVAQIREAASGSPLPRDPGRTGRGAGGRRTGAGRSGRIRAGDRPLSGRVSHAPVRRDVSPEAGRFRSRRRSARPLRHRPDR